MAPPVLGPEALLLETFSRVRIICGMELIRVPKVAEAVTEGTVSRWHVRAGERVEVDAPLVEMITEKAEDDVRSPVAGRVAVICAPERSTVPVGYVLCALAEEGEVLPDIEAMNEEVMGRHQAMLMGEPIEEEAAADEPARVPENDVASRRVAASPAARRAAREAGIELATVVEALGVSGQVTEADVRRYLESGS